jgi:glutamine synthetase
VARKYRLEFFLLRRDPAAPHGIRRHIDQPSRVYTVGPQADPDGIVREITDALSRLGLEVLAVNHEFMNSQYEVNLRHTGALRAADRGFRLKAAVKDIAAHVDWWPRSWASASTTRAARAHISTSR